jgi:ATP-dependent DNA helicase RecQ
VAVDDLTMNPALLNTRKTTFMKRVEKMISYTNTTACRSSFINEYFGERTMECGICDSCLQAKATALNAEEFEKISKQVFNILKNKPLITGEVISALKGINKEKAWKVIEFLQAEKKIGVDAKCCLHLIPS